MTFTNFTKTLFLLTACVIVSFKSDNREAIKIKYSKTASTKVPEPSDACLSATGKSLFMVSDNGFLFETDLEGKIIRKSNVIGIDFEAICMANDLLYVSDESSRKIYCINPSDLSLKQTFNVSYAAGRNSGFEAIAYNNELKQFYLISEKNETVIRIYTEQFQLINEIIFNELSDVSSAIFYESHLWLLSDEDHLIVQLDNQYKSLKKYDFKVLNPEGFYFNAQGDLTIISDDMAKLYTFEAAALKNEK